MPDAVNGPEGGLAWDTINWRAHEQNVARLRQRIFTATRDGDWPKVRNLQKMMLRSWSNTLDSVRQVAERNAGRATEGAARMRWAGAPAPSPAPSQPLPVRRVY